MAEVAYAGGEWGENKLGQRAGATSPWLPPCGGGPVWLLMTKANESEGRVLRAIDDLGQRLDRMDQRMATLTKDVVDLKSGLAFVRGGMVVNIGLFLGLMGLFIWLTGLPPSAA